MFLSILVYGVAAYVGLILVLYALAYTAIAPGAAFFGRVMASYGCMLVSAAFGIVSAIGLRLVGRDSLAQWLVARFFKLMMAACIGVEFDVGPDGGAKLAAVRPIVLISNHQSELDVLMLAAVFPPHCSVTAKASLRPVPVLGWWMALSRTIFINRTNPRDARDALASTAAREIVARRQSVFIFPEGTRSYARDPVLLPFKKGAFHLAVQAGVPIVPCVVANYSHLFDIRRRIFRSGRIPVKVLDPIPTAGLTAADVSDLCERTHDLMLRELIALTAEVRRQPLGRPVESDRLTTARTSALDAAVAS